MPNHVTNLITLNGDRKQIAEMLEAIKNDKLGIGTVSFEKIIPMPEDIYRGNLSQKEKELYGDRNWYDWCRANWGTKWNAYGYEDGFDYSQSNPLEFLTAWSAPHPVMQKLSEMFPEIEITHEWADEDIGMNCGRHSYLGGERTEEYYPESEVDRIQFAARVMEVDPQDYGLYLNASESGYISMPDEDFELIEIAGQTALFSENRYRNADIPSGLQYYQLRESDDGKGFATLERNVSVNFGGTVITKEPIDLGKDGYLVLADETSPNFLGETCDMESYIADAYEQNEGMEVSQL